MSENARSIDFPVLHYIYDPFCGWCYGAAPLIAAAHEFLPVRLHGGGMMAGPNRQYVTPKLRQYVISHDARIAHMTGQAFGGAYFDGLLCDDTACFDSMPPIAAVLAADRVAGRGLALLDRIQAAHYVEGRHIARPGVLAALAGDIGLPPVAFATAFANALEQDAESHIAASRRRLADAGGQGFPTCLVERAGRLERLDIGRYFGRAEAWRELLAGLAANAVPEEGAAAALCRLDGCAPAPGLA